MSTKTIRVPLRWLTNQEAHGWTREQSLARLAVQSKIPETAKTTEVEETTVIIRYDW